MLRGMTFLQFQEWRAYADLEPFDETRADQRTADIVRTLINLKRARGKRELTIEDVVLKFGRAPTVTPQDVAARAQAEVTSTMEFLMALQGTGEKP